MKVIFNFYGNPISITEIGDSDRYPLFGTNGNSDRYPPFGSNGNGSNAYGSNANGGNNNKDYNIKPDLKPNIINPVMK